jgi:hypothetical protein
VATGVDVFRKNMTFVGGASRNPRWMQGVDIEVGFGRKVAEVLNKRTSHEIHKEEISNP